MADDIREWLTDRGLGEYAGALIENEIAVSDLQFLSETDLEKLGLPMGPRKRMLNAIANQDVVAVNHLAEQDGQPPHDTVNVGGMAALTEAERRHLTVMFVDMVGYTALSSRLDPEDLREIVRRFQDMVTGTVSRYGGHVAKYLGDGVLAYFGWPRAYEDQAERSVRAALDVVAAAKTVKANSDQTLEVRVGIASGEVVVGDLVGESGFDPEAVSGVTPNLAARLEKIAAPGEIVISDSTCPLLGRTFSVEDLGEQELKGFTDRVRVWKVTGEITTASRFEAIRDTRTTGLVGRNGELQLLVDRWQLAMGGEGQVALIYGEPGIGKSRLIQSLRERVVGETELCIQYQCSPYHTNSALYPTIQQMEWAAQFSPDDNDNVKLDKLEALIGFESSPAPADMALFSNLLSLPGAQRYGALDGSARQIKDRLLDALVEHLLQLADSRPVLFLFEDVHWIDPTSQDLLNLMISRLDQASVLLIITHRPEWHPPFSHQDYITSLQLKRLGRAQGAELARAHFGALASEASVERIVSRAEGIPLFIEELTRSVVESDLEGRQHEIPDTLQASLLSRIDRLPEKAKRVAQISSVVGREFTVDLVSVAAGIPISEFVTGLNDLAKSEIVYATGTDEEPRFTFKHVLMQEAAYGSLLRSRRQELHGRIAAWMASRPSQTTPEVLARHLSAAGHHRAAADAWAEAGEVAQNRSAMHEAASAYQRALDELQQLPAESESRVRELDLLMRLGVAVLNSYGSASEQAEEIQRRASALATELDDRASWFRVQWGLWRIHNARAEYDESISIGTKLLEDALSHDDRDSEIQARHALWSSCVFQGNLKRTCEHADRALQIYDTERHREQVILFGGHDARECGLTISGNALFAMGYAEQAMDRNRRGLQHALSLEHPQVVGHAFNWGSILPQQLDDLETLAERLQYITPIIEKYGLEIYFTEAKFLRAWLAVRIEHDERAVSDMQDFFERRRAMGTIFAQTYFQTLISDAWARLGYHEYSLQTALEGISNATKTGEGFFLAELHRHHGMALLAGGRKNLEAAEKAFKAAIADAKSRSAQTFELRSATQLAQLWCDEGRSSEADGLLRPIFASFTEGFFTTDLRAAKLLLDQI